MPPIDRREVLKYSGSAAFAPLVATTDEGATDAARRDERSNPSGDVLPPRDLRVEYAEDPLGVQAQSRPDSARSPDDGSDEDEGDQQAERPGADWTDYAFESRFTIENRAAGFVFRAQDPGNFYLWQIILDAEVPTAEPANAILRTHVFESGLPVVRENVPFTLGDVDAQHTCRIDLEGPQITTYVDGELIHTTVDATYEAGTVGFRTDVSQAEHVLVDEVTVVDPDGEELFATDFSYDSVRYFSGGTIVDDQLSLQADDVVLRADRESSTEPDPPPDGEPDDGTGGPRPRLSWEFAPAYRGQSQRAYQVLVASSEQRLRADRADKWDSGKVTAVDPIHVAYDGEPLASGERVYWKVRVWDQDDRVSDWSDVATWEMGLLDESDWQADWIGSPQQSQHQRLDDQWTDYTVEATFTVGDGSFGVPFRARDSYNLYLVELVPGTDGEDPRFRFRVRENGQWETLKDEALDQSLEPDTTHQLRIEISGTAYDTYLDDEHVDSTGDGTHGLGRFGFYTPRGVSATVEDLEAMAPDGTVLHADDFSDPATAIDYADGEVTGGNLHLDGTGLALLHVFHPFVTPSPLLRREVTFEKPVAEARAYVSGLGFYELSLNGERVGDQVLDPGRTDYEETVLYATHDVTDHLQRGHNAIGIALGRARFGEHTPNVWNWHDPPWWSDPQLLVRIDVEFADGSSRTVVSDEQWAVTDGPTRLDSLFGGEAYDARREPVGWTQPGYDDADWDDALPVDPPGGELVSQAVQPLEVTETLESVERTEPAPGVYVFDVGQTIAGWIELTVEGPAGTDVKLTTGEKLNNDGTVNNSNGNVHLPMQVDRYVLSGEGTETWESRFSYKGFRYVQIEGYPGTPSLEDVRAKVVHTALEEGGHAHFATSNELLDQIHENAHQAFLNNMHSVPTDTPKFEKNGWTGDALVTAEEGIYNFSMARFWRKWLRDCRDAQADANDAVAEEGNVPVIVPSSDWGFAGWTPDPGWQSAYPLITWWVYQYYGEERILEEHYEGMKAYLEYLGEHTDDHIVRDGLGDWAAPLIGHRPVAEEEDTDNPLPVPPEGPAIVSTAYYYRSVQLTARAAEVLGRDEAAAEWTALSEDIEEAFNEEFFYPGADVYLTDGTGPGEVFANTSNPVPNPVYRQTSNVMPLAFDMVPDGHEEGVVDNLVRDIEVANGGHLNTGVHGTKFLLRVLTEYDRHDVAYTVASQRTYPSWGWWIENDMTALLEFWSLDARSRDHHFLGTVDEWFYRYLAGIRAPEERGFGHVEIAPELVDDLEWVEASTDTVRGEVASRWEQSADGLDLDVTIPGAATATVRIPDLGAESPRVSEGGTVIWAQGQPERPFPAGIEAVSRADDAVVVEVGAGEYAFRLVPGEANAVGSRADDGAIFTGGQSNRVDLTVSATEPVRVRDRVPDGWTVAGGDAHEVYTEEGQRFIEFAGEHDQGEFTYFAEAPEGAEETGRYTFGLVEVAAGSDAPWQPVGGTSDSVVVVGPDTNTDQAGREVAELPGSIIDTTEETIDSEITAPTDTTEETEDSVTDSTTDKTDDTGDAL